MQIPGLTLPLNHVYPLVVALSITQIIHEAGHALCGTLQSWNPLRMGLILFFPCVPGAFVVLPEEAITGEESEEEQVEELLEDNTTRFEVQMTRKRLRNISAGVWHNALTAMLLALVIYTGMGRAMHNALWRDAKAMRVESIDAVS
jgi:S2P endopeptidase